MIVIEDAADPRVARFGQRDRVLGELFLAEGDLVVERALAAGCRPVAALVDPQRPPAVTGDLGVEIFGAGADLRRAITHLGVAQAIVALFERPDPTPPETVVASADRLVVVEAVDNPSNVGAVVRNAAALGWDGLLLDRESADPLARRSLRVAMGTAFSLPHARVHDVVATVRALTSAGFATFALTPDPDAADLATVAAPERCVIAIGAERSGLSAALRTACTHQVRIALAPGVDSLNVAAATAIACHALRRPSPAAA